MTTGFHQEPPEEDYGNQSERARIVEDSEAVHEYFHNVIADMEREGRLTQARIKEVYERCAKGLRDEGREDMLSQLEELYCAFLGHFLKIQGQAEEGVGRVVGAYTTTPEEPPSPPSTPGVPGRESPEEEDLSVMIENIDATMKGLMLRIDDLEKEIASLPEDQSPRGTLIKDTLDTLLQYVQEARQHRKNSEAAGSEGGTFDQMKMHVALFAHVAAVVEGQAALLEGLIAQARGVREHMDNMRKGARDKVVAAFMEKQWEQKKLSQDQWQILRQRIDQRQEHLKKLRDHNRAEVKIKVYQLLEKDHPTLEQAFQELERIDQGIGQMKVLDETFLRDQRTLYDAVLIEIQQIMNRAEKFFEELSQERMLSIRRAVGSTAEAEHSPEAPVPAITKEPIIQSRQRSIQPQRTTGYEKNPPRGLRVDQRTGLPIPPNESLLKKMMRFFFPSGR